MLKEVPRAYPEYLCSLIELEQLKHKQAKRSKLYNFFKSIKINNIT